MATDPEDGRDVEGEEGRAGATRDDASGRVIGPPRRVGGLLGIGALLAVGTLAVAPPAPEPEPRAEFFRTPTPHEAHRLSLSERGLAETSLGGQWLEEARRALTEPAEVRSPYLEEGRFVRPEADALGYRVEVDRGQRLEVRLEGPLVESGEVMVDLYRVGPDPEARPARVRSLPPGTGRLDLEPEADGAYVVRVQPRLFADGRYRVSVRAVPALRFPVAGRDNSAVWSMFGAPRGGGAREHHGIDIFARRGTPVIAVSEAYVRRVDETPVGGKVVWLRDPARSLSIYYAHLDSQAVEDDQRVSPGDTLGFVGNTGNARTTPPHLHFGIYQRGPVDPFPFVRLIPTELPDVRADVELAGAVARARTRGARIRSRPSVSGDVVGELDTDLPFRVVAATGDWYRIRLPDGSEGYVSEGVTEDPGLGRIALAPLVGRMNGAPDGADGVPSPGTADGSASGVGETVPPSTTASSAGTNADEGPSTTARR